MRILVVGAGGTGGYFGARLLAAKRDVTFLVRARRAAQLAEGGLNVESPSGDLFFPGPPTVTTDRLSEPFDLVLLSCKAYDLDSAADGFAPAMGPQTLVLPLLNGMRHLDALDARFGAARILGGRCMISATLDERGTIRHLSPFAAMTFGDRGTTGHERLAAVATALGGAGFDAKSSDTIVQDMWEKWVFLATLAGSTCLMRATIGEILSAPGGRDTIEALLGECAAIAGAHGHTPREPAIAQARTTLGAADSPLAASMLRDIERGGPIEADQIVGDLLARRGTLVAPVLQKAYTHLKAYEAHRARAGSQASGAAQ